MKANSNTMTHEATPVVSELNKVAGFNPLKFIRKTDRGYKLDLRYKKLWFRLKYPAGRIKLSPLRITDQLAIIEARVYFDKADAEPKASFIAQREAKNTPGGLYIEAAQHAAIDRALSDAGFGLQFPENASDSAANQEIANEPSSKNAVRQMPGTDVGEEIPALEKPAETKPAEQPSVSPVMAKPAEQQVPANGAAPEADHSTQTSDQGTVEGQTAQAAGQNEEIEHSSTYTPSMTAEEIMERMSYEEACNVNVSEGICKGQTLAEVADRRPASLKYYAHGYAGNDNVLRAAARIILAAMEQKMAS